MTIAAQVLLGRLVGNRLNRPVYTSLCAPVGTGVFMARLVGNRENRPVYTVGDCRTSAGIGAIGTGTYLMRLVGNRLDRPVYAVACCSAGGTAESGSGSASTSLSQSTSASASASASASQSASSDTIQTSCCANPIKNSLTVTFSNGTDCPCAGGSLVLTYNAGTGYWESSGFSTPTYHAIGTCTSTLSGLASKLRMRLRCFDDGGGFDWGLTVEWEDGCGTPVTDGAIASVTCSPFQITSTIDATLCCDPAGGTDTINIVITETP